MDTRYDSENLCIISKDGGDYLNIDPKDIFFDAKDYRLDTFWWIPYSFTLKVDIRNIYFVIAMNAISIDSNFKIRGHYWRYHLNCFGNIIIDNEIKNISGIQIAEFNRFR